MKSAVDEHEAPSHRFAYLVDRIKINEKLPQIYGTQWVQKEGKVSMHPVEDIDNIDRRRSEVGLCTISEYKEGLKNIFHLTDSGFG
jgi:hypothetical protein